MRIALATVGTTGDIAPFVLLAGRLVARGHEVTAISWPVHRAAFLEAGVRVEVAGPHADAARIAAVAADVAGRPPLQQVAILRDFHLADGEDHYRRLRTLLPGHDVVVVHGIHVLAHAAVLDAELAFATAVFDPVLLPTRSAPPPGLPPLGPLNRPAWWMLDRILARVGRPVDRVLARAGSAQRGLPLFRARSPRLHLLACSPAIIRVPTDLPAGTLVSGAWLDDRPVSALPSDVESFLTDGAAPIVIGFGSMAGAPEAAIDGAVQAILEGGRRVVVQGEIAAGVSSPSLIRVGAVDHRALFPRSALVVHHGGSGTTHAVVAAGVPSLVIPHVGDQPYWADRLRRLGVAPQPQPVRGLRANRLASAALAGAADPAMRRHAAELASRLENERGLDTAADAIEGFGG
jgi:UDP:flavonoid glycosyltransferase YjiC (YdhE family)